MIFRINATCREFLWTALAATGLWCGAVFTAFAGPGKLPDYADWRAGVRPDHPRIFFSSETWPAIAETAKGAAREDLVRLLSRCDGFPDRPVCSGTDIPASTGGAAVDFTDTPIPDIRDWGDQAAACALAWRFTGDRRYLEKAKAMLRTNIRGYGEAFANRRAVGWYAHSRINSLCAYDWIFEALTADERREIIGPLLKAIDRFTNPAGRPRIRRLNGSAFDPGSYGEPTIDFYAGLAAIGEDDEDGIAESMMRRGYATYKTIIERHLDGQTAERTLGSETPGYSLGDVPPGIYNFLRAHRSATGVDLAHRLRGLSLLPEWLWWLWIPDPDHPWEPMYCGAGDDRHDNNRLPSENLREHLLQVAQAFRDIEPQRARLAVTLAALCPKNRLGFNDQWPLLPFILRSGDRIEPFSIETLRDDARKARRFARFGQIFMRSGWRADSTYAFIAAGFDGMSLHRHYDEGGFVIYKHDFLALDSGSRAGQTDYNLRYYYGQSVAHNVVLVEKPDEPLPHYWGPKCPDHANIRNFGGMTGKIGKVIAFETTPDHTHVAIDLKEPYGGKCSENIRQFVHVQPDCFVVYDRVTSENPLWTKRWLLHTQHEPRIDGTVSCADSRGGRLFCETLLPVDAKLAKVGGPGREFWAGERNWPLQRDWEKSRRAACARRGRGPYWGAWRVETQPGAPRREDRFLHVLTAASTNATRGVAARRIATVAYDGVELELPDGRRVTVTFARTGAATCHCVRGPL